MKTACLHYFSGTGNTAHVADLLRATLAEAGYAVTLCNIEDVPPSPPSAELQVFAFPVYAFAPPAPMRRYLKRLPEGAGQKTAVLSVGGSSSGVDGFEGQASPQVRRLLQRRGYDVFLVDFVSYPENWTQMINPPDEEAQKRIFGAADRRVRHLAGRMATLEPSIRRCSLFNRLWSKLVSLAFSLLGRRYMGKSFVADGGCTGCGLCARICPAPTVRMVGGRPRWGWRCLQCNRCINLCPRCSIQTSIVRLAVMGGLSLVLFVPSFWRMVAAQVPPFPGLFGVRYAAVVIGGVGLVAAVSLGADYALALLERIPGLRRLVRWSFTKHYRRYRAPGFTPSETSPPATLPRERGVSE